MLNDNDSSWVAQRMIDSINIRESEALRPSVIFHPRLFLDGNMWCALLGDNIQEGVCGFGKSPDTAMREFDKEWYDPTNRSRM